MNHRLVQKRLLNATFKFAKSKAYEKFPHAYTLSKDWNRDEFDEVVQFIRDYGEVGYFFKAQYLYYRFNGYEYWTMGAAIEKTILINKAKVKYQSPYDNVGEEYSKYWDENEEATNEELNLLKSIEIKGRILDIGSGTGMLLKHIKVDPSGYVGLDISATMIKTFKAKYPDHSVIHTGFEHYVTDQKFDTILALFGTASYLKAGWEDKVKHHLTDGGTAYMMFYKKGYKVLTHDILGFHPKFKSLTENEGVSYTNYIIKEIKK